MVADKNRQPSISQTLLYTITNWLLLSIGVVNLVLGTWAAYRENTTLAISSLTAGLIIAFAATIDRFESLKGLGVEATTKKLDEKIQQADEAMRKLKQLAEISGSALVDLNSKMGRWDSAPEPRDAIALIEQVKSILKALESDEATIADAIRPGAKVLFAELAVKITTPVLEKLQSKNRELDAAKLALSQAGLSKNEQEISKLTEQIDLIGEFISSKVNKLYARKFEELPHCMLEVFDKAPVIDHTELLPNRRIAEDLCRDIEKFNATMTMPNTERWIAEIDAYRGAQRGR